jgi:hypothetical protein
MDVLLLHAHASRECLPSRCLAMDIHVTILSYHSTLCSHLQQRKVTYTTHTFVAFLYDHKTSTAVEKITNLFVEQCFYSYNFCLCLVFQSPSQQEVLSALKRRLEQTAVPEFPRHRLRMLSKLAEGAFGTVSCYNLYVYVTVKQRSTIWCSEQVWQLKDQLSGTFLLPSHHPLRLFSPPWDYCK